MIMKKSFIKIVLFLMVVLIIPFHVAFASTDADVLQVYITEQTMTVFVNEGLHSSELQVLVSNQNVRHGLVHRHEPLFFVFCIQYTDYSFVQIQVDPFEP